MCEFRRSTYFLSFIRRAHRIFYIHFAPEKTICSVLAQITYPCFDPNLLIDCGFELWFSISLALIYTFREHD